MFLDKNVDVAQLLRAADAKMNENYSALLKKMKRMEDMQSTDFTKLLTKITKLEHHVFGVPSKRKHIHVKPQKSTTEKLTKFLDEHVPKNKNI